jgi:hypothetical protein
VTVGSTIPSFWLHVYGTQEYSGRHTTNLPLSQQVASEAPDKTFMTMSGKFKYYTGDSSFAWSYGHERLLGLGVGVSLNNSVHVSKPGS